MIVTKNPNSVERYSAAFWGETGTIIKLVILSIVTLFCLKAYISFLYSFMRIGNKPVHLLIFGLLCSAYCIYSIIAFCRVPHTVYEKGKKLCPDLIETLCFGEAGFSSDCSGTNFNQRFDHSYGDVIRAFYKGEWFVLYCKQNEIKRSFAIHNSSFVQGSPQELINLLSYKLGAKFKVK